MDRIVYICFDPSKCAAAPIIDLLINWDEQGTLYLYVQNRDNEFHKISSYSDLEQYFEYLRTVGSTGIRPSFSTLDDLNKGLITILDEHVMVSRSGVSLVGENDNMFSVEIIVPGTILADESAAELIERMLSINELRSRCKVHYWETDDKTINIKN